MLHLKLVALVMERGQKGVRFFSLCMKDNLSVSDRHAATALIKKKKKGRFKTKVFGLHRTILRPGSLSAHSSGPCGFSLLSHRFIIQLSSKTHVKLDV